MNELALFAGGGGGLLGSILVGWRTVCYVERDAYCVEVIKARIRDGYLHDAPIWDDARTFDGHPWAGLVDVLTAGFPCQPFSVAGKGLAELDERNLWPDTIRVIREVRPEWCLLENVPGLFAKPYIRRIFADLAQSGYDARWDSFSAAGVGAPHGRERKWIVAHTKGGARDLSELARQESPDPRGGSQNMADAEGAECERFIPETWQAGCGSPDDGSFSDPQRNGRGGPATRESPPDEERDVQAHQQGGRAIGDAIEPSGEDVPDTERIGLSGPRQPIESINSTPNSPGETDQPVNGGWWAVEPELGRVAHGVAHRVDRLRAIGNGQVPAVVRRAWRELGGL